MTVARVRSNIQSLSINADSFFEVEVLRKGQNDAKFMPDCARAQEALLVAQISKLAQQLAEVQKILLLFMSH